MSSPEISPCAMSAFAGKDWDAPRKNQGQGAQRCWRTILVHRESEEFLTLCFFD
ncbi:hypothetical protein HFQ13_11000 [Acidithiobacillus sp. VAN18-1]|uniref:Uncharacterized protein n=1 Tax=Igneacidithiobacillus copahuensis TaxID=2724909 RepID=A0AAE3CKC5_9PROT|nr:hypothetical protein [Igneacidithiobacillus copahuensis]